MYLGVYLTIEQIGNVTGFYEPVLIRDYFHSYGLDFFTLSEPTKTLVGIRIVIDEADTNALRLKKDQIASRFKKMGLSLELQQNAIEQYNPQKPI